MRRPKLSLVACSTLVMLALVSAAWAGTQFGSVSATGLVTLVSSPDTSGNLDFFRLKTDGTRETNFFRVKKKTFLVVTDVEFLITGGTGGDFVTVDILILRLNLTKSTVGFSHSLTLDALGNGSANVPLNAGFVIDSNARPGVQTSPPGLIPANIQVILHGYLSS